jgi:hypothetical protein
MRGSCPRNDLSTIVITRASPATAITKRKTNRWVVAGLVVLALYVLGRARSSTPTTQSQGSGGSAVAVSADERYNEYSANEVAADAKYRGRAYVVVGGDGFGVQCMFAGAEEADVALIDIVDGEGREGHLNGLVFL